MEKRYRKMERKANGKIREIRDLSAVAQAGGQVVLEVPLPIADVLAGIPGAVEGLSHEIGLMFVLAVIESECERIAGVKDSKNPMRTANWWGSQPGAIYYDKQKVLIDRPRLRGKDNKEIQLSTYRALQNPKGMNNSVMKQLILGISACAVHADRYVLHYMLIKASLIPACAVHADRSLNISAPTGAPIAGSDLQSEPEPLIFDSIYNIWFNLQD